MKTTLTLIALATLLAGSAFAQSDIIIKKRAKEIRDQNNVRQGVAPPTQPATPGAGPNAPAAPQLTPALATFQTTLAGLRAGSPATAEQKQKLAQNLLAAALGPKPSFAAASRLVEKLAAAFADKPLSSQSLARFVQELDAILNPSKYPQAKPEGIFADIQAIFQENGLARPTAVAVADDVKALAAEVQQGGARPGS